MLFVKMEGLDEDGNKIYGEYGLAVIGQPYIRKRDGQEVVYAKCTRNECPGYGRRAGGCWEKTKCHNHPPEDNEFEVRALSGRGGKLI